MARVLFEDTLTKDPSLRSAGVEVDSAGAIAGGAPATLNAIRLMREYGLDLSNHQSKLLVGRLVKWADLILVMQARQKQVVVSRYPGAAEKTYVLSEYVGEKGEVPDPIGCGIGAYEDCVAVLSSLLSKLAERLREEERNKGG
jgi:protein-tyrosine-phosphatase